MIRIAVTPRGKQNLYGMLVQKELALRKKNQGTLHRSGKKKAGVEKWVHNTKKGWIRFQKCLDGMLVATVQSLDAAAEWELLNSFIGFLDRHFRTEISNINLSYELIEE